jgi:hypothetical protein
LQPKSKHYPRQFLPFLREHSSPSHSRKTKPRRIAGKTAEAHALLANFLRESKSSYVTWYGIWFFYVGLGDKDEAFACLEKAYAQHDSRLRDVKQEPMLESLHSDPRFPRLVQRVGL